MKCSCCGKRKGIMESFERIDATDDLNVCVKCAKSLYIIRESIAEGDTKKAKATINKLMKRGKGKMTNQFNVWLKKMTASIDGVK